MPPPLLVFDTATEHLAVALVHDRGVEAVDEPGGARASQRLLPVVGELLERAGLRRTDLAAIGFGRGPGAFTGLRTACAVAQGLAMALQRPLVPIDTLAAVAEDAWQRGAAAAPRSTPPGRWWVLQDARMDELYAACWQRTPDGDWTCQQAPALWRPADWQVRRAADDRPFGVAGSAIAAFGEAALSLHGLPVDPAARPSASALAAQVRARWAAGDVVAAEDAHPLYVRDRVAQTIAERTAARPSAPATATGVR